MEKTTNEELARMINKGFNGVQGQFDHVQGQFDHVNKQLENTTSHLKHLDGRMDHLDARMGRMEADLNEIRGNIVYRHEFEDLAGRVQYIEKKLSIESGV